MRCLRQSQNQGPTRKSLALVSTPTPKRPSNLRESRLQFDEITQRDLERCLKPLWHLQHDTAKKALSRLNVIIKYAAALGLNVDVGVVDKARQLLGPTTHQPQRMPALSADDTSAFYQSLNDLSPTHLCMKLVILTGLRCRPVRFARLEEFDGDVWVIPGEKV